MTDRDPGGPTGPLQGLKVIDMTTVLMGPSCTQMLGDMGADVIKIEARQGDVLRGAGLARHPGMGAMFLNANRSKRSVAIDLKRPEGLAILKQLLVDADIFICNVRPKAMGRLGLAHEDVQSLNPRLIYVSMVGFDQSGPYAARPAYDDLIQGACGLAAMSARMTGAEPVYGPAAFADRITGLSGANQVLAAVYERSRSGLGQKIEIPMLETMVQFVMADHMEGMTFKPALGEGGNVRQLSRSRHPFKTRDGYICALIYSDEQWRTLFRLAGKGDQFDQDPRFASLAQRYRYTDEIYAILADILATDTTAAWLAKLTAADLPCMPMHDLDSLLRDPHLTATNFFETEQHPSEGELLALRTPSTWSRTQPRARRPAPRLGEHTQEVLAELGTGREAVQRLVDAGIVGQG